MPHQHIHEQNHIKDVQDDDDDDDKVSEKGSSRKIGTNIDDLFARQIHQSFVAGQGQPGTKVEYNDFAHTVATLSTGETEEKINFMFSMYDVKHSKKRSNSQLRELFLILLYNRFI